MYSVVSHPCVIISMVKAGTGWAGKREKIGKSGMGLGNDGVEPGLATDCKKVIQVPRLHLSRNPAL